MEKYLQAILISIVAGFVARAIMLRNDHRHYPTYPHGHVTHLSLGFMAASLGAVAIPAIAEPDYVAVTFLVLGAQQFREIRKMERDTLAKLETQKIVNRGDDYIEGIARVFEARNYLVIFTSMVVSGLIYYSDWRWGMAGAILCWLVCGKLMQGVCIGHIAVVEDARLYFDGSVLKIKDVVMMNVGLETTRKKILAEGLAVILKPVDDDARLTLDAPGQRMAIIHDVVSILGSKVDINETELMPIARKDPDQGYLALFFLLNEPDIEILQEIIKKVPVLESNQGATLKTLLGRKAAD